MSLSPKERKMAISALGLTQQEIADALGVHQPQVGRVIRGQGRLTPISWKIMGYLAAQTGIPLLELFPGVDRRKVDLTQDRAA